MANKCVIVGWPYKTNDHDMLLIVLAFTFFVYSFFFLFSLFPSQVRVFCVIQNWGFTHPSDTLVYPPMIARGIFAHVHSYPVCTKQSFNAAVNQILTLLGYFFNRVQPKKPFAHHYYDSNCSFLLIFFFKNTISLKIAQVFFF